MKDGWIKVAAAAPELHLADCAFNAAQIAAAAERAAGLGAKLLVTPELSLTGYTCGDLFFQRTLQDAAEAALEALLRQTQSLTLLLTVGLPVRHLGKLYNCAAMLYQGRILGVVPKVNLPNYEEFQELRFFCPAPEGISTAQLCGQSVPFGAGLRFSARSMPELTVGMEICEDLWVPTPPSVQMCCNGATIIVNLCASHELAGKAEEHRQLVISNSRRCHCGYVFSDAAPGESTTDVVFGGHQAIAEDGVLLAEAKPFGDGFALSDIDVQRLCALRCRINTYPAPAPDAPAAILFDMPAEETRLTRPISSDPFTPENAEARAQFCSELFAVQCHALARRMSHIHSKTAVIGVSGGLDSTLALLVAARAMELQQKPHDCVVAVTMPCFGTTARTKGNAAALCEELGITLRCVSVADAVRQHFADISHDPADHNVTYENAQARERTQVLMDLSNDTGGIVVGTGDLSELALGWATYNGDHMSMYGVNAGIPKTQIRHIVRQYAETCGNPRLKAVLLDVLDTPVSPELLPAAEGQIAQKTEDLVGPYELHDFFLFYLLRDGCSPKKIYRMARYAFAGAYDDETIKKWLKVCYRRFFAQQYKRSCLPDGPMAGPLSLSPRANWRMPSDAFAAAWQTELEAL